MFAALHGLYLMKLSLQDIRGSVQNAVNAVAKSLLVVKRRDEKLSRQMQTKFQEEELLLPYEIFY